MFLCCFGVDRWMGLGVGISFWVVQHSSSVEGPRRNWMGDFSEDNVGRSWFCSHLVWCHMNLG